MTSVPGVTIELSTANRYVSALSVDEFLTVYTIVKDLDLASIQCQMSLAFLAIEKNYQSQQYQQQYQPSYMAPAQPQYYQQQVPYTHQYQAPAQQTAPRPQNQNYSQPRYNNNQGSWNRQQQPRQVQQQPVQTYEQPETPYMKPQAPAAPRPQQGLPARDANKPVMSLGAVEATPISEITYDDVSNLDDIFNN
jgi:hypothetical protein